MKKNSCCACRAQCDIHKPIETAWCSLYYFIAALRSILSSITYIKFCLYTHYLFAFTHVFIIVVSCNMDMGSEHISAFTHTYRARHSTNNPSIVCFSHICCWGLRQSVYTLVISSFPTAAGSGRVGIVKWIYSLRSTASVGGFLHIYYIF